MRSVILAVVVLFAATMSSEAPRPSAPQQQECGPTGTAYMRTTLYFGLSRKTSGHVSNREWSNFLRDQVTTRFPQGFTVWEANGQWRLQTGLIAREPGKVLLVIHEDQPALRAKIAEIIDSYKKSFDQESVLWETAKVCAAF